MIDIAKIRIWAIIGEADTGKSTLIRGLTGSDTGSQSRRLTKNCDIPLRGGGILRMHYLIGALQESGTKLRQKLMETLLDNQNSQSLNAIVTKLYRLKTKLFKNDMFIQNLNILLPLRHQGTQKINVGAFDILNALVRKGAELQSIVVLIKEDLHQNNKGQTLCEYNKYKLYGVPTLYVYREDFDNKPRLPLAGWERCEAKNTKYPIFERQSILRAVAQVRDHFGWA